MISVLLADDHDIVRQGIRTLLKLQSKFCVCGEARNGEEAVDKAIMHRPDVALLDISMPRLDGLEAARRIKDRLPETQVLIFTVHDSSAMVRKVLEAGANGYILKSDVPAQLIAAVEAIAERNLYFSAGISRFVIDSLLSLTRKNEDESPLAVPLTARETEILSLLALGKSNKEVAQRLFISVRTVETHRRAILLKLKIHSRAELVRYAVRCRLIEP